jgi:hypothetical protein
MRAVVCAKACSTRATASGVWADTAYRSTANETFLTDNGLVSHIHRKKPTRHDLQLRMAPLTQG